MLPKSFSFKWIAVSIIVILAVASSSWILSKLSASNLENPRESSQSRAFPTEVVVQLNSSLNILYQDPNDKDGRTVIYNFPESTVWNLSGHGFVDINSRSSLPKEVGLFQKWIDIKGSKDRYISLYDPMSKKDLPLFRVAFEPSSIFDGEENMTALARENIEKLINKQPYISLVARKFSDLSESTLNNMIHKNDTLAIVAYWVSGDTSPRKDGNGLLAARVVYIRRY